MHSFYGHFPHNQQTARVTFLRSVLVQFYGPDAFLVPTSRNTLGFIFSASITTAEVEGVSLQHQLSNASTPTLYHSNNNKHILRPYSRKSSNTYDQKVNRYECHNQRM